jgi:hypothetical protein
MSQKALPSLDSTHTLTPINTEKIHYDFFSDDEESTEHHLTATSKINNTITTKTRSTRKNSLKFYQSCISSWPQAKISSKLQLYMASSQDFQQTAIIHGLKPRIPPSFKSSWP